MSSIKKNFIYNLVYQVLIIVLPLLTTPYISRVLGAERIGVYSYAYSVASYFVMFAMLGLNNYGNREIAFCRDDRSKLSKEFLSIYFMQLIFSSIAIIAYIIFLLINRDSSLISIIMLVYVISAAFDVNWFFFGLEKFKITVTRNLAVKIITIILIFAFVHGQGDLYKYALILILGTLVSNLVIWPFVFQEVEWYRPSLKEVLVHVKPNLILFVPVIAVSLYKIMDKVMLGILANYEEVGFYECAEKVLAVPNCAISALGTVMLPRMANLVGKGDAAQGKRYYENSLMFAVFVSTPLSLGFIAIADIFVPFFYGQGYETCIYLFYALMPSCVFMAVANVIRTQYFIPRERDKEYIISLILGACVNVVSNSIMIPRLKSMGAAIGTLLAEATVCLYQVACVRKETKTCSILGKSVGFIIIGVIMVIVVHSVPVILNSTILTLALKVCLGGIAYLAGSALYFFLFCRSTLSDMRRKQ